MKLRILVIDDEPCITDTMQWHLEDQGHEVLCAPDPTACSVYQGETCDHEHACCDILFVDMHMPRMDGLTFVEHMAKKGCKGLTKNKVVMSGALSPKDFDRAAKLGCKVFNKPVSLKEVDRIVERKLWHQPFGAPSKSDKALAARLKEIKEGLFAGGKPSSSGGISISQA